MRSSYSGRPQAERKAGLEAGLEPLTPGRDRGKDSPHVSSYLPARPKRSGGRAGPRRGDKWCQKVVRKWSESGQISASPCIGGRSDYILLYYIYYILYILYKL